jgi:general stress protein 26
MFQGKSKCKGPIFFSFVVLFFTSCGDTLKHGTEPDTNKAAASVSTPWSELNMAKDSVALLLAARSLMAADTNVAFVTVDSSGRPRVRTVYAIVDEKLTNTISKHTRIWIMTRASTRKISQLRIDPRVTLYYNDDATVRYASIMGIATLYTDPNEAEAAQFLSGKVDPGMIPYFWPNFPQDFALIKVQPQWIEYLSKENAHGDSKTWRPQAVVFTE